MSSFHTFFKEEIVSLPSLVQLIDGIYEEAPTEVVSTNISQNFAKSAARHTMDLAVAQQVKDAIEKDTLELQSQHVLVRADDLADEVKLAPCLVLFIPLSGSVMSQNVSKLLQKWTQFPSSKNHYQCLAVCTKSRPRWTKF